MPNMARKCCCDSCPSCNWEITSAYLEGVGNAALLTMDNPNCSACSWFSITGWEVFRSTDPGYLYSLNQCASGPPEFYGQTVEGYEGDGWTVFPVAENVDFRVWAGELGPHFNFVGKTEDGKCKYCNLTGSHILQCLRWRYQAWDGVNTVWVKPANGDYQFPDYWVEDDDDWQYGCCVCSTSLEICLYLDRELNEISVGILVSGVITDCDSYISLGNPAPWSIAPGEVVPGYSKTVTFSLGWTSVADFTVTLEYCPGI